MMSQGNFELAVPLLWLGFKTYSIASWLLLSQPINWPPHHVGRSIAAASGSPEWLSDSARREAPEQIQNFLLMYQTLAANAQSAGLCNYHLVPKFHNLSHLGGYIQESGRNPRFDHCYSDEGLMGFVSKIASATHALTMDRRVLERYRALLDMVQSLLKRWPLRATRQAPS